MRLFLAQIFACCAALAASGTSVGDARAQTPPADDAAPIVPLAAPAPIAKLEGPLEDVTIEPRQVRWNDDWPKFRISEYILTGLAAATAFGSLGIPDGDGRWKGRNSFDEGARDAFRLSAREHRETARDVSDFFLVGLSNQLVIDTIVVTWWHYGAGEAAWQTTLITAEVIAVNTAINSTISGITARQRPYGDSCESVPIEQQTDDCNGQRRYRSFYSGHTSTSFAAASALCMNHMYLGLYGSPAADALACGTAYTAAATVGAMRLAGDEHWMSDVMVGAAAGTLVGLSLPYLLHYRGGAKAEDDGETHDGSVQWLVTPTPNGGTLLGTF